MYALKYGILLCRSARVPVDWVLRHLLCHDCGNKLSDHVTGPHILRYELTRTWMSGHACVDVWKRCYRRGSVGHFDASTVQLLVQKPEVLFEQLDQWIVSIC